jgi:AcrR family transcriptional regulator
MSTNLKKRPSADETRSKILTVAQKLFSKKGFAGTSISDIAQAAKINQSLIYHHFEDKKKLWKLVKANVLANYSTYNEVKAFETLAKEDFASFLSQILKFRFDFYDKTPDVVRMISWQRLEPERKELQSTCYAPQGDWYEVIQKFQKAGEIRADLEPEVVLSLIWNSVSGVFLDHYPKFEAAAKKPEVKKKYLEMLTDCTYRALRNNKGKVQK